MVDINFTVDAALLRELGARLVGQPHIALAELIKNSYDADARHVRLTFTNDRIVIEDDGHGMSFDDFVNRWMRIGTTHKKDGESSPELGRTLTGSKGVGRLATQLLARRIRVESVGLRDPGLRGYENRRAAKVKQLALQVEADVDWGDVDEEDELTEITVPVEKTRNRSTFVDGSHCGTRLVLEDLVADWDAASFRALAQEIWVLQPPFAVPRDQAESFEIELLTPHGDVIKSFGRQMEAILENWQAFISFELLDDDPDVTPAFEFDPLAVPDVVLDESQAADRDDEGDDEGDDEADEDEEQDEGDEDEDETGDGDEEAPESKLLRIEVNLGRGRKTKRLVRIPHCLVDELDGQIRVYNLTNRQANNVLVEDARNYMSLFGGVHIYDSEFRLPYYGPQDWLDIERDAARRLSQSELLPKNLKTARAMQDLPARRRLFGVANISTAHEIRVASSRHVPERDALSIQSSRDRLVTNRSLKTLKGCVRLALDLYATDFRRAKATAGKDVTKDIPDPGKDIGDALGIVNRIRDSIEESDYEALTDYLADAKTNAAAIAARTKAQSALLGSLATVGMTTLAWEHESTKQRLLVYGAAERLERAAATGKRVELLKAAKAEAVVLKGSAVRLDEIAQLFRPVLSTESRESIQEARARRLVAQLVRQLKPLARGADETTARSRAICGYLQAHTPAGRPCYKTSYSMPMPQSWRPKPGLSPLMDGRDEGHAYLRIEDTGVGVDLDEAESYFEPFTARQSPKETKRARHVSGWVGLVSVSRSSESSPTISESGTRFTEPTTDFQYLLHHRMGDLTMPDKGLIVVCDDNGTRADGWANNILAIPEVEQRYVVRALGVEEFADGFEALRGRQLAARPGLGRIDGGDADVFDKADIVIVDFDLTPAGTTESTDDPSSPAPGNETDDDSGDGPPPEPAWVRELAGSFGHVFAYLVRCYSTAAFTVLVNQDFPTSTFDLTMRRFDFSFADLNVAERDLSNPTLWTGVPDPGEPPTFRPWHWPRLLDEPSRMRTLIESLDLENDMFEVLGLDGESTYAQLHTDQLL